MKYHATVTNENGVTVSKGGNERLTITLQSGNKIVATLVQDAQGIRHDIVPPKECKHLVTMAEYKNEKLQGYRCNCGELVKVNPQYRKNITGK